MVWEACKGEKQIKPISGVLYRMVESQEQIATLGYVDTLAEQAVLEELLDSTKPPVPDGCEGLNYLLYTPFRYPPLKWGSRFGKTHEPSLFYGGSSQIATLAESAFYRLVHFTSMEGTPPKPSLRSAHTLFSVNYKTEAGIQLQKAPFKKYEAQLKHPQDYSVTQKLGAQMRNAGVQAFEYISARTLKKETCVALYTAKPLVEKQPNNMEQCLCETSLNGVGYKPARKQIPVYFEANQFMVDGQLPLPA